MPRGLRGWGGEGVTPPGPAWAGHGGSRGGVSPKPASSPAFLSILAQKPARSGFCAVPSGSPPVPLGWQGPLLVPGLPWAGQAGACAALQNPAPHQNGQA